jgi:hypothetical protein
MSRSRETSSKLQHQPLRQRSPPYYPCIGVPTASGMTCRSFGEKRREEKERSHVVIIAFRHSFRTCFPAQGRLRRSQAAIARPRRNYHLDGIMVASSDTSEQEFLPVFSWSSRPMTRLLRHQGQGLGGGVRFVVVIGCRWKARG